MGVGNEKGMKRNENGKKKPRMLTHPRLTVIFGNKLLKGLNSPHCQF